MYAPGLLETIAKVGTRPSAGGSRAAIAKIISHMGVFLSRIRIYTVLFCKFATRSCLYRFLVSYATAWVLYIRKPVGC